MSRVAVVTDTTGYLPTEVVRANQIQVVSLYVNFGGERTVREADITDYDRFYDELRTAPSLPTTSQPAVGDFLAIYEPLIADGLDVLSIHISAGLSGTCGAARQAVESLERSGHEGRVRVFDSATGAGGIALLALAAAKAARDGGDLDAVEAATREARGQLKIWFAIDTLEYLRRGGRIGGARAWIGSALKIKPILTLEEEITPVERVRTRARSIERLRDYARQRHESGLDAWVIQHIQDPDAANALADDCREIFDCESVYISEIGPVIGAHVGPGLLGVGSVSKAVLS
jgi:DegV family protein with EDD domain